MQAVNSSTLDIRRISEKISTESTHSVADVMGVIIALGVKMQQHLEDGKIIGLVDVGKFKIGFLGLIKYETPFEKSNYSLQRRK